MSWKQSGFTVTLTIERDIPADIVKSCVERNIVHGEFKKINAIKDLKVWFEDCYNLTLGLKDAKEIIEAVYIKGEHYA